MRDLFNVSGKIALVTGGSTGIGEMIARGLVENGAEMFIVARRHETISATVEKLSAFGTCVGIAGDLSTVSGIESVVKKLSAHTDRLDIVVNNAGCNWQEPIGSYSEQGWDKVMSLNLKSVFYMVQKTRPMLRAAGSQADPSRVINIASINGQRNPGLPTYAYSASKAGVIHLTQHLATDLSQDHINVNAIAPGLFPSEMTKGPLKNDAVRTKALAKIPRGRMGMPEDIAGTAIYLSTKASSWMTGQTLTLDGGQTSL